MEKLKSLHGLYNLSKQELESAPYEFDLSLFDEAGIKAILDKAEHVLELYGITNIENVWDELAAYKVLCEVYDMLADDTVKRDGLIVTA